MKHSSVAIVGTTLSKEGRFPSQACTQPIAGGRADLSKRLLVSRIFANGQSVATGCLCASTQRLSSLQNSISGWRLSFNDFYALYTRDHANTGIYLLS